jgi:16S rRNA (guanine(966)-N(2))-methyltransferase RsmD
MRIIAGRHRGRRIRAPAGLSTRPMLDRVREAMFGTLGPWIEDARVLDLFAGSGSLALEALSRGASAAHLVEKHPATLRLLRENVTALALDERVEFVRGDALAPQSWQGGELFEHQALYDLIFMDPPYALMEEPGGKRAVFEALTKLVREHLGSPGYLVLHVPRGLLDAEDFAPDLAVALRRYGSNALWYVTQASEESIA